ncbi:MAG: hypothetical protein EGR73_11470 [Lachnospiraceae bacterium]|nr:hypothetical protein [Lachnospiraceae bacterium]
MEAASYRRIQANKHQAFFFPYSFFSFFFPYSFFSFFFFRFFFLFYSSSVSSFISGFNTNAAVILS